MAVDYHVPEPFPLFVDSKPSSHSSYYYSSLYSSKMSLISLFSSESPASHLRARIIVPDAIVNYISLKHYQYEVTFGLYLMDSTEKAIVNTFVCTMLALLMCGIVCGLQPLLIRFVCRMFWCWSGSYEGVEDICS